MTQFSETLKIHNPFRRSHSKSRPPSPPPGPTDPSPSPRLAILDQSATPNHQSQLSPNTQLSNDPVSLSVHPVTPASTIADVAPASPRPSAARLFILTTSSGSQQRDREAVKILQRDLQSFVKTLNAAPQLGKGRQYYEAFCVDANWFKDNCLAHIPDGLDVSFHGLSVKGLVSLAIFVTTIGQSDVPKVRDAARELGQRLFEIYDGLLTTFQLAPEDCPVDSSYSEIANAVAEWNGKWQLDRGQADFMTKVKRALSTASMLQDIQTFQKQIDSRGIDTVMNLARREIVALFQIWTGIVQISDQIGGVQGSLDGLSASVAKVIENQERPLAPAPKPTTPLDPIPPEPELIGREAVVQHLLEALTSETKPHVFIHGLGGIGKTSVAVKLLYRPEIISAFKRRPFIDCDKEKLDSAAALMRLLLRLRGQELAPGENPQDELIKELSRESTLLVLDNFETPCGGDITRVAELLSHLVSIRTLTLLITSRDRSFDTRDFAPRPVVFQDLEPLDDFASLNLFHLWSGRQFESDPELPILLDDDHLAGYSLVIVLVASYAKEVGSIQKVLKFWDRQGSTIARTPGARDRLHSLDISLNLSIQSATIQQTPDTLALLSLIGRIAGGVPMSVIEDAGCDMAFRALKQSSLAYESARKPDLLIQGRSSVPPPLRRFAQTLPPVADFVRRRSDIAPSRDLLERVMELLPTSEDMVDDCVQVVLPLYIEFLKRELGMSFSTLVNLLKTSRCLVLMENSPQLGIPILDLPLDRKPLGSELWMFGLYAQACFNSEEGLFEEAFASLKTVSKLAMKSTTPGLAPLKFRCFLEMYNCHFWGEGVGGDIESFREFVSLGEQILELPRDQIEELGGPDSHPKLIIHYDLGERFDNRYQTSGNAEDLVGAKTHYGEVLNVLDVINRVNNESTARSLRALYSTQISGARNGLMRLGGGGVGVK